MIRLFVSDLDGTLLNENHQLDDRILQSIDFVLDNQCDFAIATMECHAHIWALPLKRLRMVQ